MIVIGAATAAGGVFLIAVQEFQQGSKYAFNQRVPLLGILILAAGVVLMLAGALS